MSSFRKPFTVRRRSPGTRINGRWVEGQESTLTIMASVQPLKLSEMEALPEGRRQSTAVKVYTSERLYGARAERDGQPGCSPDILEYMGADYEIVGVSPYQSGIIPHYKAFAVEVGT